ncbi:MAG: hypothetical protein JWN03_5485 [Nocardia sp.]|uniref:methyltransferase family protein n=1 Tax=Nocardia sp. TaxID=1821 RepID=UPI0026386C18|nr:isoprenylcysteine carboxylmethyltransferase family protein [Nocardia sp.]MCU1645210.1 hypothetical protein [Nocardia sp.]
MGVSDFLQAAAGWSFSIVGLVWVGTAVWFAAVRQTTLWGKIWHFLRTLLPEPWMILGLAVLVVVLDLLPHTMWDSVTWKSTPLTDVGSVLVIAGAALMVWARLALGTMWAGRPMIQQDHELRTGGPYRLVRHPIYTGILGAIAGLTLVAGFGSETVILVFVIAWLGWRVHVEDRMLIATFGDQYRDYQKQVGALIPLPRTLIRA